MSEQWRNVSNQLINHNTVIDRIDITEGQYKSQECVQKKQKNSSGENSFVFSDIHAGARTETRQSKIPCS